MINRANKSTLKSKSKEEILEQIKADIIQKNICPDLAKNAKQLVFGSGNPEAKVVFIGEAPGKNEDKLGLPFVGASGKLLDELLRNINVNREDVYITNIVKYRPPENRDPSDAEKNAFLPFLYAQLEIINPKVIVTLGRHSTNCFLPDMQISNIHGQLNEIKINDRKKVYKFSIFPSYHPAVAIYNRNRLPELQEDFLKLQTILNSK